MFVKENCIHLGHIGRTHGIHGQLILISEIPLPNNIIKEPFLVDIDGGLVPFYLESLKNRDQQSYLIKFDHISDKEQAEQYVTCEVYILSLPALEDGKTNKKVSSIKNYLIYDEQENFIGKIDEILDFSGNTLVRLFVEEKEIMLPFTESHILDWNDKTRKIKLRIPDGLLNL